jgi:alanine racemase
MLIWDKTPALASMRCCRAWVEINLSALAQNVRSLKSLLPTGSDLMAVVKADAYGHGAVTVAQTALSAGATWLGVATVPEGIELRQAGIAAPILVMGAVNDPEEIGAIAHWQLQPTIVHPKQALIFSETLTEYFSSDSLSGSLSGSLSDASKSGPLVGPLIGQNKTDEMAVPVHLKIDTGMSRLGFRWTQAVELARFVQQLPHLKTVSLYSHLATADSPDPTVMTLQYERFEAAIAALRQADLLPERLHLANSAATLAAATGSKLALYYDMVRVGLSTYGLYPAPHLKSALSLQPVLEVKARITLIKAINPGDGVSYSHQFVADRPMKIAIVGIGYADGVPRALSNKLKVAINGQLVDQIGAITMDQLMLDVSALAAVQEGDVVTLLGQDGDHWLSADHWAEMAGTISWEILCSFKHRLPRVCTGSPLEAAVAQASAISSMGLPDDGEAS